MTKEEKKLIELLEFTINEKANESIQLMDRDYNETKKHFHHGQYMAYSSIYTMLQNIKRTL